MQFAIYIKTNHPHLGEGWIGLGPQIGSVERRSVLTVEELQLELPKLSWEWVEEVKVVRVT